MSDDYSDNGTSRSWLERVGQFFTSTPGSRDELLDLMRSMRDSDIIDGDTLGIIEGAICVSEMQVREILIPRSQMVSIRASDDPRDFLPTIIDCAHSRFPVLGDDPDEIIGILLAKDLLALILEPARMERFVIKDHVRSAMVVPESKRLDSLLREFRITKNHMAIVVNEYGGVAGLVTIEDVLEQIVGEIEDEHDVDDDDYLIKDLEGDDFTVKAITPIDEFNEHFKTQYRDDEFDTIGGLVMQAFGHLPQREESVDMGNLRFTVLSADGRTIRLLRVAPLDASGDTDTTDG
ncbi:MAG TPA: magnesium/cobalt efflux protein [Alcanivorax sp.]|jgi:hemolysin (HlyC) family protein|uniref:Magnesium and cobalt efflux protein CorC n=1 Tax=Alloalcanivorax venustensis ISO4 TaxID=1177184 RepID=A0ABS0AIZ5_9GAMM|nr:transporter associated domain-containing protein [Alloalcanivorax venustensis]MAQ35366.1 magnesium/cobalt efflux protein [Alcanivorax sp.]MBF48850.1 magnesium/cobalt efflux protein [Alcanivorax sp.]MBF5054107.1 metal ion transporter [Alloalcanivorax venustensis ISO4]MBT75188.1 magnesium/cobalt efflux protein [Alcanivorax sp.]HAD44894.1 magnesium/cobalt efflux protein [Alcanivorax sp.]|tara:strand:- start:621 stop:1496 length:876 start_codon:yes stop_codon:yes gene_type:complete